MSNITGKDIYSTEEWKTILLESEYEMNDEIISQLTQAIADYHSLNKKVKENIPNRQKLLGEITILCEKFISIRSEYFCTKPANHQKELDDTLDYWVSSLQKKSVNKSKYLHQLNDFL